MNLYEIRKDIDSILERGFYVDQETGEVIEENLDELLMQLEVDEKEKLENIGCCIKNLEADINSLKTEEKALYNRRKIKENKIKWLQNYLKDYFLQTERKKFESTRCVISLRKSNKVDITDPEAIIRFAENEPDILRFKEPEINRTAISKLLKSGANVPGAQLIESQSVILK